MHLLHTGKPLYGDEDLSEIENQGDFFGIIVDTGLACFIDRDGYNVLAAELTKEKKQMKILTLILIFIL